MGQRLTLLLLSGHTIEVRTDDIVIPARGPNEYAKSENQFYAFEVCGTKAEILTVSPALIAGVITHSD